MTKSAGTLYNYTCSDKGLLLPIINEYTWSIEARAFIYIFGLLYCFLGVAIVADIFMCAIEKITSKTRKITLSTSVESQPEVIEVKVWNDTVANLTLMALGSSAPEILLSIIEIVGNEFKAGDLGPGTIVGSAAFNLLVISAVCVMAIPAPEIRRIRAFNVFGITAFFSVFAYIWLLIILVGISPNVVELWEALITLLFFPLLVILAYLADVNFCMGRSKVKQQKQIQLQGTDGNKPQGTAFMILGSKRVSDLPTIPENPDKKAPVYFPNGKLDRRSLVSFIKEVRKHPGLTDEDAACLAAARMVDQTRHSRMWYRVGAIRDLTGGRKPKPRLSMQLKEVYDALQDGDEAPPLKTVAVHERNDVSVVEFEAASCAVMENVGKVPVAIKRYGKLEETAICKVETLDGTAAAGEDYVAVKKTVTFEPYETHKTIDVEIINDNQWEPDETFFLKLSVEDDGDETTHSAALGRICVMEVTILNDDEPGQVEFKGRGMLVKETIGNALIPVVRRNGADGEIKVKWRTIDKTAISGEDYQGGEGEITFSHGEIEKNIEVPIIDDCTPEKDEHFEVELFDTTGGAVLGQIKRTTVTITNDDEFNNILGRMATLTNVNIDNLKIQSDTWAGQLKDALNVNGGDIENASTGDYVMHFFTFGWKVIFALIPPTSIWGGWLTFCVALGAIGILTAIVGDLASIFGCLVGLKDSVTAITFVALGTSLPDLFASKAAACQEKYADNAIGNVTGSNSVNVFLGLGLPWVLAAIYWQFKGIPFAVPSGDLAFSVGVYTGVALAALIILMIRRVMTCAGKGELGGPKIVAQSCGSFMIGLWFLYVLLSSLQAYEHI